MLNKVTLIGNLGKDPEVKALPSGGKVCQVSLATTRRWKDKQTGERKEATEWHQLVFFNRLAEIAGEYLAKGSQIYVEGRLQTRKWQTQEGQDRYTTEILVEHMHMLGNRAAGGKGENGASAPPEKQAAAKKDYPSAPEMPPSPGSFEDYDDDIPF